MKNDSSRFWITILIAFALLFIIDITIGVVADKIMDKMPNYSGQLAKDNYRLHRLNTDIVIIGSSRGSHHYVTQQLSDSLDAYFGKHLSIYNAAIDGKFANSNSCAAEMIIARYRPKLVIFDISEDQLCSNSVDDIEFSAPYYWKDTIVHRYLNNIGLKECILMKSSLYRYNMMVLRIVSSFLTPIAVDDGYLPLYGTNIDTTKKLSQPQKTTKELYIYTTNNFENVLKKYSSAKVPLVIVSSPRFRPNDNNKRLAELCEKYDIPFIDIYDSPYFNSHPELFKDAPHLNNDGAHTYTSLFFKYLKPYLLHL